MIGTRGFGPDQSLTPRTLLSPAGVRYCHCRSSAAMARLSPYRTYGPSPCPCPRRQPLPPPVASPGCLAWGGVIEKRENDRVKNASRKQPIARSINQEKSLTLWRATSAGPIGISKKARRASGALRGREEQSMMMMAILRIEERNECSILQFFEKGGLLVVRRPSRKPADSI